MHEPDLQRRAMLGAALAGPMIGALSACSSPLPVSLTARSSPAATSLLNDSAAAHGLAAFKALSDISYSHDGSWRVLIDKLQPVLVDPGFRGKSEDRLLPREGVVAMASSGAAGRKFVVRRPSSHEFGEVRVWFNGEEAKDAERRAAAALVADAYRLILLGPMLLTERNLVLEIGDVERVNGLPCDVLRVQLAPGLGHSLFDQAALFIDRQERLLRRLRFSLEGLQSTRGTAHEVDMFEHQALHGMRLPTRFAEQRVQPTLIAVRDWRLTGLDVNRGFSAADLAGPELGGAARQPAAALSRRAGA
jgi:hypothetical protein